MSIALPKNETNEIRTDLLEIFGKTLVFENSIYQISNISAVEVGALRRSTPIYFWIALLLFIGSVYAQEGWWAILFLAAAIGIRYWSSIKQYGLILRLNSGFTQLIVSNDMNFLKDVAVVLRAVMDSDRTRSITIKIDQRKIVDNVSGSAIILGDNSGKLVNANFSKNL